jgi:hypothetical protein
MPRVTKDGLKINITLSKKKMERFTSEWKPVSKRQ